MKERIKNILLVLLLCTTIPSVWAHTPSPPIVQTECNLPAPTTVAVSAATTNSLAFEWSSVSGAIGYAYTLTDAATNTVVASGTSTNTNVEIQGLLPVTSYVISVSAICPSGETSCNSAITSGCTLGIIIDVVVYSINPPSGVVTALSSVGISRSKIALTEGGSGCDSVYYVGIIKSKKGGTPLDTFRITIPRISCCGSLKLSDPNAELTSSDGFKIEVASVLFEMKNFKLTRKELSFDYNTNGLYLELYNNNN